jgi:hypothetical protein
MAERFQRRTVTLVVRLWQEPMQDATDGPWRGQIERVATGERAQFQAQADLADSLAREIRRLLEADGAGSFGTTDAAGGGA